VFAGQNVGIKEVTDRIWLVTFMHYDLGFFDRLLPEQGSGRDHRLTHQPLRWR
jgi:hypothetical protein